MCTTGWRSSLGWGCGVYDRLAVVAWVDRAMCTTGWRSSLGWVELDLMDEAWKKADSSIATSRHTKKEARTLEHALDVTTILGAITI